MTMKELRVVQLTPDLLKETINCYAREDFDLHEYRDISSEDLRENFLQTTLHTLSLPKTKALAILEKDDYLGSIILDYLEYDSRIFSYPVYRITSLHVCTGDQKAEQQVLQALLSEAQKIIDAEGIRYVIASINTNHSLSSATVNHLVRSGFDLINTLISFKMDRKDYHSVRFAQKDIDSIIIREATQADADSVIKLASSAYRITRYHLDARLDKALCDKLYATSVENAVHGRYADEVLVAEMEGRVIGYYTAKKVCYPLLSITVGYGLLTAVDSSTRGMGVYSLLNNAILDWYYRNTDVSEMGTYLPNKAIHKTFTNNGLAIVRGVYQLALLR